MKVQEINTPKGERYIVLDNNFKVIKEVKEYLKFLDNLDKAQNTLKNYAQKQKIKELEKYQKENENYKQKYDQLLKENKSLKEQLKNSYEY